MELYQDENGIFLPSLVNKILVMNKDMNNNINVAR
jgi:hypothetical protein